MWLPTEVLLWEAAQAGPGGQFSAAITFCVSSVISASLQCHTSPLPGTHAHCMLQRKR